MDRKDKQMTENNVSVNILMFLVVLSICGLIIFYEECIKPQRIFVLGVVHYCNEENNK